MERSLKTLNQIKRKGMISMDEDCLPVLKLSDFGLTEEDLIDDDEIELQDEECLEYQISTLLKQKKELIDYMKWLYLYSTDKDEMWYLIYAKCDLRDILNELVLIQ